MESYLVINSGNTMTNLSIFRNGKIVFKSAVENSKFKSLPVAVTSYKKEVKGIFIGTVNPEITQSLSKELKKKFGLKPYIVNHSVNSMKINYSPVESLGIDRLANAVGAANEYGLPLTVVDLGTATTFNVVNTKKEFVGGAIAIGLNLAKSALHEKTVMLPEVKVIDLGRKINVIGKTTEHCLQSGLLHGLGGMIDGMIERIQRELGVKMMTVIATGGNAKLISPYSKTIRKVDTDITLKGIYIMGKYQTNV